eukprot:CAMPEP_0179455352 /NCGR_PEP_ID=MMETSP0799-20121207/39336_1 /TAXON_ID=46947 /ORGANISM="Geminigera cryophila, Strain CCMP2564" /LENGTH=163 /DNA_ID=CAMNT_0021254385 /DNA_START=179 /DNA_END=670 /DNA_ORIENTATION=-
MTEGEGESAMKVTSGGESSIKVSYPTPNEGAIMGIREWPGYLKKTADFEEQVDVGTTRYIIEGQGICTADGEDVKLEAGTLIECTKPTTLNWKISDAGGKWPIKGNPKNYPLIILTPEVQDQKVLLVAGAAFIAGMAFLLSSAAGAGNKQTALRARDDDDEDE